MKHINGKQKTSYHIKFKPTTETKEVPPIKKVRQDNLKNITPSKKKTHQWKHLIQNHQKRTHMHQLRNKVIVKQMYKEKEEITTLNGC